MSLMEANAKLLVMVSTLMIENNKLLNMQIKQKTDMVILDTVRNAFFNKKRVLCII